MRKKRSAFQPLDEEGWASLRSEVLELFTPGSPIDEVALFAGRQEQIQKLRDVAVSKGRHAVVFGERGVGKTSLASIFHLGFSKTKPVAHVYVQCGSQDNFQAIWRRALRRIEFNDGNQVFNADELIRGNVTPDELEVTLTNFGSAIIPIIVFDEFDRIQDKTTKTLMSETIKSLSNSPSVQAKIILVGVADSVTDLLDQHQSLTRALVQVRMPRMQPEELKEIITSRVRATPIKITDAALWRLTYLASGLPFYSHAIGQAASLLAVKKRDLCITEATITECINDCFGDLDQSLLDSYVKAVTETRKGNIFKHVLAACALADHDELGRFSGASVEGPLSAILGKQMQMTAFSFHLNELCNPERGSILAKSGNRSHFRFRFVQPIIQPFITMKSLATGVIDNDLLAKLSIQRQRSLSI